MALGASSRPWLTLSPLPCSGHSDRALQRGLLQRHAGRGHQPGAGSALPARGPGRRPGEGEGGAPRCPALGLQVPAVRLLRGGGEGAQLRTRRKAAHPSPDGSGTGVAIGHQRGTAAPGSAKQWFIWGASGAQVPLRPQGLGWGAGEPSSPGSGPALIWFTDRASAFLSQTHSGSLWGNRRAPASSRGLLTILRFRKLVESPTRGSRRGSQASNPGPRRRPFCCFSSRAAVAGLQGALSRVLLPHWGRRAAGAEARGRARRVRTWFGPRRRPLGALCACAKGPHVPCGPGPAGDARSWLGRAGEQDKVALFVGLTP